jgi:hypothetical protein
MTLANPHLHSHICQVLSLDIDNTDVELPESFFKQ